MNYLRLSDMLFNQPLLATESMVSNVATYLKSRMYGAVNDADLAVNFQKSNGDASQYLRVVQGTAILPVMGGLTHRAMGLDALCTGGLSSYAGLTKAFDEAMADDSVTRIVMHVDSGGGQATGCFDLANHIMAARGKKPITCYVDGMAASAAYALACAADEVIASPYADVGSIGVIMVHQDYSEMLSKEGIQTTVIKAGANKGLGSPYAPLSEDAKNALQGRINELYSDFVGLVSSARSLAESDVRKTEASVYNSEDALKLGLIDKIMSPDEFLAYITPDQSASATEEPRRFSASAEDTNQETEMTEQELQELNELRAFKAQAEAATQMSSVVGQIQAHADAIGFDATEAANALLAVGMDNQLSTLFMSVLEKSSAALATAASDMAALKEAHESELASVKETAQAAVETSEAMAETGVAGAAQAEEENAEAEAADPRKADLQTAMQELIASGNFNF